MKDDITSKELAIEYPCVWRYKVITVGDMQAITKRVLKDREYTVEFNNQKGGYKSYNLKVLVFDSKDREALFRALEADIDIKFIL
ncbi:MAG: DUF493 domain-containing protein [Campylobacteraceae bacterium]|nr:DUF493 domain-containing protein [Campylobacteraceae bacterium]